MMELVLFYLGEIFYMVKRNISLFTGLICLVILSSCNITKNISKGINKIEQQKIGIFTKFSLDYNRFYLPSSSNEVMYMTVDDNSKSGMPNKLIAYDYVNKETKEVFQSKLKNPNMQGQQANKEWVLWTDTDDFGTQSVLYVKNIHNGKQKKLYETEGPIDANLYQHFVTWTEIDPIKKLAYIKVYDLKNDTVKTVATTHSYDTGYSVSHMNQGKLVYSDGNSNETNLYLYDLKSGETIVYPTPHKFINNIRIVGNKIFYATFPSPDQWYPESYFIVNMETKNVEPFQLDEVHGDSNNNIGLVSAFQDYMVFQTSTQQVWIYKLQDEGYKKQKLNVSQPFQTVMSEGLDINIICEEKEGGSRYIMLLASKDLTNMFQDTTTSPYNKN